MLNQIILPKSFPGHWETDHGFEIASEYIKHDRLWLCKGNLNDFFLAKISAMIENHAVTLVGYQTAVKERIRWLSVKLAVQLIKNKELQLGEVRSITDIINESWSGAEEDIETANRYSTMTRDKLLMSEHSDFAFANAQYLTERMSPDLKKFQTAAAERIMWLSVHLVIEERKDINGSR